MGLPAQKALATRRGLSEVGGGGRLQNEVVTVAIAPPAISRLAT
jgi:hypothetical protein